ncbi:alpha/beta fold hydrolase [Nocardioides sp. B-3]|uniref:alpha/beta fold hydrolase n=1 Tax=Nocardioides sp. B-3 TaxID=2895565 RepID=UPI002152AB5F|nr:alpha/beta fold hydrolase [Nocardioides sp. B-3]UUZ61130.1 alpha/beta fold hydrolase [Nocardioides sp. B-3]
MLDVNGARVRVSERGEGRPLLLVMGIGGSLDMWRGLEAELVPRGYRTISFDLPGAGGSPPVLPPLRMPGPARIAVAVLDALGLSEVDVPGVSFGGGAVAQRSPARRRSAYGGSFSPQLRRGSEGCRAVRAC